MQLKIQHNCIGVDGDKLSNILQNVGMAHHSSEAHCKAIQSSYAVVFLYDSGKLIGFGRANSDGAYQAAVYDCAVLPTYQGKGLGKRIMEEILSQVETCNVILYASPGKEGFYEKLGFSKLRTGMARLLHSETMHNRGFTQ